MSESFGLVILAAGEGTRLKWSGPKPLAPILGECLVDFPIRTALSFLDSKNREGLVNIVIGHEKEKVRSHIESKFSSEKISTAVQKQQRGTADALRAHYNDCPDSRKQEYTIVLCADTPVMDKEDLERLYSYLTEKKLDGVAATFIEQAPTGYGRIVRTKGGFHIVEEKDADDEVRKINEVNSGLYLLKTKFVLEHLDSVDANNNSGEFYLTDLFKDNFNVSPLLFDNRRAFLGVNTLEQLEEAQKEILLKIIHGCRNNSVRFVDSSRVYLENDVVIDEGSVIYPDVYIHNGTRIGKNVIIEPGSIIKKSNIGDGTIIKAHSYLEESEIGINCNIGPFARIRPQTKLGENVKIGNFVEAKKAVLDSNVSVSHLSYVGDAEIGENTNIGCGFITCNYDGESKGLTKVGKNTFIGSDTQTIAPIEIGESCYIASGSTINQDMPSGSFAISRGRQITKEGIAKKFLKGKWSVKK